MTFLKTLLIILLVYYGLKMFLKLAKPYIMKYIAKKAEQRFGQAFGNKTNQTPKQQKEGSVTIDSMPSIKKSSKSTEGDYVDYEEID